MANDLKVRADAEQNLPRALEPMHYAGYSGSETGFDGSRFTQFMRHNYKLILIVMFATIALLAAITAALPQKYTTRATVLLDQRHQQPVEGLDEVVSNLPGQDSSVVDTEVQLLSSPGMAYQVGRATGMIPDVDPGQLTSDQRDQVAATVRNILKNRSIARVGLTYIIEIYYTSTDPLQAQQMADAFAQNYVQSQIGVRVQANSRVRDHLTKEIERLQSEVTSADAAVAKYKADHNLSDTMLAGTLTDQEIISYNQALAGASAQEAEDSQRLRAAQTQFAKGSNALGDATSPGLTQLRAQEATLSARVADLSSRYGPNHPDLVNARDQLKDIQRLIADQSRRSIASLQSQAQASAGRASAIAAKLAETESALQRGGEASVQLHDLQAKLDAPKKLLEAYQQRLAEISTQSGSEQADARIISAAPYPDRPTSPNWIINLVLGVGAGIVCGVIAVLIRQIFAVGMETAEEIETSIGVDFLAAVPRLRDRDDMMIINKVVDDPHSPFTEALRSLAASVLFGSAATPPRVIGISSPYEGEGKTTTTIALGRVMAMRGRRVLIIDGDMQRPSFYDRYGIGNGPGLVEVLQGQTTLDNTIASDSRTPAHFLTLGRELEPGQALDERGLATLFDELRLRYDVVLVDLPPVLQVAETRVIAALADTNVLLARWRTTSRQALEQALATLIRSRATVVGIALTQVPATSDIMVPAYRHVPRIAATPS